MAETPNVRNMGGPFPSILRPAKAERNVVPLSALKGAHVLIKKGQEKDQDLFLVTLHDGLGEPYDST